MNKNRMIKKILLFVINVTCFTSLLAQPVATREVAHIDLPEGTLKLSRDQFKTAIQKRDSLFFNPFLSNNDEYYTMDSFLLSLHGERIILASNYLENRKKDFDTPSEWNRYPNDNTSEIRSINNYRVLIAGINTWYHYSYFLFCVNRNNNAIITGQLVSFKDKDYNKDKTLNALNELLENIAFKL